MDDGSPIRLLVYIVFLLIGAAYFASAEMALSSTNRIRMMNYADDGNEKAVKVLYILDHFDSALTTLLICNNIMHIGCATLATLLATRLWGTGAVTLSTIVTTVVVFLLAEMLPKSFAKACNEQWSLQVSSSMIVCMKLLKPVTILFTKLSDALTKLIKGGESTEPTVTEDELHDIIDTIVEEGELDQEEGELVQNALEFAGRTAANVYTPIRKVVRVNIAMDSDTILSVIETCGFSRLLVTGKEGLVLGVLPIRSYLKAYLQDKDITLSEVMADAYFVSEDTPIDELMEAMNQSKTHMVVVLDKEGETLGVITMEDILEELVGEIYDEQDTEGGVAS